MSKISDKLVIGLNYDDIVLVPTVVNQIESRDKVDTTVNFFNYNITFPIIASPMPDVCDGNMALELGKLGGFGIIHRFQSPKEQAKEYDICHQANIPAGCAIGVNEDWLERLKFVTANGCDVLCIDVANGACGKVAKVVDYIKKSPYNNCRIIAGNIASKEGFEFLAKELNIDGVRCGIAGGSVCSTKIETGVYSPMFSMLKEIREIKDKYDLKTLIIADGNIKKPADLCKALVFADIAMAGGIFAGTEEAPGNVIKQSNNEMVKLFRGAASFSTQKYESGKKPTYVEGIETFVPYTGSLSKIVERYKRGLRSSMTYFNSLNLTEYKQNINYQMVQSPIYGV